MSKSTKSTKSSGINQVVVKTKADEEKQLMMAAIDTVGKDRIATVRKALVNLANLSKKSIDYYYQFGELWIALREQVKGNKKLMGKMRVELFSDKNGVPYIDAMTASYAARMVENWNEVSVYRDEYCPRINNPRLLVQDWINKKSANAAENARKKAEEEKANKTDKAKEKKGEKADGTNNNTDNGKNSIPANDGSTNSNNTVNNSVSDSDDTGNNNTSSSTTESNIARAILKKLDIEKATGQDIVNTLAANLSAAIVAMNDGRIKGELLDDLDRQVANIRRQITRHYAYLDNEKKAEAIRQSEIREKRIAKSNKAKSKKDTAKKAA